MAEIELLVVNVKTAIIGRLENSLRVSRLAGANLGEPELAVSLTNGADTNQANRCWEYPNYFRKAGDLDIIDLYDFAGFDVGGGDGRDALGQQCAFEEIVAIAIKSESSSVGQLEIIPDLTNGWTPIGSHTVANGGALRAGGCLFMFQPHEQAFDVVDGSSHRIRLTATGGDVTWSIYILARHDDDVSSSSTSTSSSSSSSISTSSTSSRSSSSISSSSSSSSSTSSSSSSSSGSSSSSSGVGTFAIKLPKRQSPWHVLWRKPWIKRRRKTWTAVPSQGDESSSTSSTSSSTSSASTSSVSSASSLSSLSSQSSDSFTSASSSSS